MPVDYKALHQQVINDLSSIGRQSDRRFYNYLYMAELVKALSNDTYTSTEARNLYKQVAGDIGRLSDKGFLETFYKYIKVNNNSTAWTPAALFANGENGVWVDPSDLSTMYVDPAGTIPVANNDDLVGRIVDKVNGVVFEAPAASARPTYKTDGTRHWLSFDGVNDELIATSYGGITGSQNRSMFMATSDPAWQIGNTSVGYRERWTFRTFGGGVRIEIGGGGYTSTTLVLPMDVPVVVGCILDGSTLSDHTLYLNGESDSVTEVSPAINTATSDMEIGIAFNEFIETDFYGGVLIDRVLTSDEIAALEAWLAEKGDISW